VATKTELELHIADLYKQINELTTDNSLLNEQITVLRSERDHYAERLGNGIEAYKTLVLAYREATKVQAAAAPANRKPARESCKRCRGKGVLPQYKHIDGGHCFRCS
jgi:regulator of replication initiation timing